MIDPPELILGNDFGPGGRKRGWLLSERPKYMRRSLTPSDPSIVGGGEFHFVPSEPAKLAERQDKRNEQRAFQSAANLHAERNVSAQTMSVHGTKRPTSGVAAFPTAIGGPTAVAGEADTCNSAYRVNQCALPIL
jgi:hypothetical protein